MTPEEFRGQLQPRFGRSNPERVSVPFWLEQIRTGDIAWLGKRRVLGETADVYDGSPVWSFDRFGMTATRLPDGRVVCIAGEHEDHYDPDFYIYNDVMVFDPAGVQVYLYQRDVFPPTDFHATVWVDPYLYVVGSLGHQQDADRVPMYRLDTRDMHFEAVPCDGPPPQRLHRCFAKFDATESVIRVIGGRYYPTGQRIPVVESPREQWFELKSRRWREGPPQQTLRPPFTQTFGRELEGVVEYEKAYDLVDVVRRTVPYHHPLWAVDLWPVYANISQAIFRIDDGSERYAVIDLNWGEQRSTSDGFHYRMIEGGLVGLEEFISDPKSYTQYGDFALDG